MISLRERGAGLLKSPPPVWSILPWWSHPVKHRGSRGSLQPRPLASSDHPARSRLTMASSRLGRVNLTWIDSRENSKRCSRAGDKRWTSSTSSHNSSWKVTSLTNKSTGSPTWETSSTSASRSHPTLSSWGKSRWLRWPSSNDSSTLREPGWRGMGWLVPSNSIAS